MKTMHAIVGWGAAIGWSWGACGQICDHASGEHPVLAAQRALCDLPSADPSPGDALPVFDPAAWSILTPRSAPTFQIIFDDPTNQFAGYTGAIQSNLAAACARWAQALDAPAGPVVITLAVRVDNSYLRATARSELPVMVGVVDGIDLYEQGAAYEVRTGIDPNGTSIDGVVTLNTSYVANELWFDPNPAVRSAPVPANRTDAVSVFLHEVGHILAFNGWRDSLIGSLAGNYQSRFDQFMVYDGNLYFEGPLAQASYAARVPLTYGSARHVANPPPRPGADLIPDLMNGLVFMRGVRYDTSALDMAITRDCGVTVVGGGPACDTIDFNNDGLFPDTLDIDDFLTVFSGGVCSNTPACNDIDFNNDGLFPDTLDIDALLSVFSGGACLA